MFTNLDNFEDALGAREILRGHEAMGNRSPLTDVQKENWRELGERKLDRLSARCPVDRTWTAAKAFAWLMKRESR